MSPVWIPWAIFWAFALFVMARIFKSAARRDRISMMATAMEHWTDERLQRHVNSFRIFRESDLLSEEDLESLDAGEIAIYHRKIRKL